MSTERTRSRDSEYGVSEVNGPPSSECIDDTRIHETGPTSCVTSPDATLPDNEGPRNKVETQPVPTRPGMARIRPEGPPRCRNSAGGSTSSAVRPPPIRQAPCARSCHCADYAFVTQLTHTTRR